MVSHIEPPDLLPRRPPSVTSRASTSRRHRSSRSYHSPSAPRSQNDFPIFSQTGEVEILLTSLNGRKEQRYLLHRLILSQASGFFEADLRQHGSADRKRWRYVLDWGNTPEHRIPMLVQRDPGNPLPCFNNAPGPPPVSRNKPPASSSAFFRSMSNFSALNLNSQPTSPPAPDDELLRDYDNMFRIFYNYPPTLDAVNIANAYTECKSLLYLAEAYDALDVVGSRVDHHLLRFQGRLFKQIAKYPPSYLKLAYLAKSRVIFSEALVHIVGQWPLAAPQLRGQIDLGVLDLIEDKVEELEEVKMKVEAKLFRLTLTTSRGERVKPANSYLDWLAMSLFRQWFAENTTPAPVSILKDTSRPPSGHANPSSRSRTTMTTTATPSSSQALVSIRNPQPPPPVTPSPPPSTNAMRIYRLLGSTSSSAYLSHDEMKRFLKLNPDLYTRDNLRRFERRMDELKNLARDVVRPLTRNCLELDLASMGDGGGSLGYLTCTKLLNEDFPWDD
ncbi:hypothetical protein AAFC00_004193 [Neodothiora populina]|uniref:BTB domain-containing protein n=1 Tax=Neodothiora populina TaxID=2781224 RepID=A0ABR3PJ66_9PEZI